MIYIIALYFSMLITTFLIPPLMKVGVSIGMVDEPNPRKVHTRSIPRTGGMAIIFGMFIPFIFAVKDGSLVIGLSLGALCIAVVGILDDVKTLGWRWKFLGQIVAAAVILIFTDIRIQTLGELWPGVHINLGLLSVPVSMFFLLATTNIINLSDGLDGLAGGMCLLMFCTSTFLAYFQQDYQVVALCACMIGATIGFMRYNTHPAVVFLGDTGSQFLGLMVGVIMMLLMKGRSIYSPLLPLYIIGIPVIDTSLVILERLLNRRHVFKPDKNHLHHKLLKLGLQHGEAVSTIYGLQLLVILVGWTLRFHMDMLLLSVYLALLGAIIFFLHISNRAFLPFIQMKWCGGKVRKSSRTSIIFPRQIVARMTWYGLLTGISLFFFISPFVLHSTRKDIGVICLGFVAAIVFLKRYNRAFTEKVIKMSAYFMAIYYITAFELQADMLPLKDYMIPFYNIVFVGVGACYLLHLISASETVPILTIDYLLLSVVIFTFFLPESYLETSHLHTIAAKFLLTFFSIELIFYKLKEASLFTLSPVLSSLGLNCMFAFLL